MTPLRIVVGCTDQKTATPEENLRLRSIAAGPTQERVTAWLSRLQAATPIVVARSLYKGDTWVSARRLEATARDCGFEPEVWIASAGYGLISSNAPVAPYSATFSSGSPDSVGSRTAGVEWWKDLATWSGPSRGRPRSVLDLVRRAPSTPTLVVLSSAYVCALQHDLEGAALEVDDRDALVIVSSIFPGGPLDEFVVRSDARLQKLVGGARQSLNLRVASRLLQGTNPLAFGRTRMVKKVEALIQQQPPLDVFNRVKATDEDVLAIIRSELAVGDATKSLLLRKLRDDFGIQCEQKRFGQLFERVMGSD